MDDSDVKLIFAKLDKLQQTLDHIEARQIKTTKMVEDVQEHEAPVVGSFGSVDHGDRARPHAEVRAALDVRLRPIGVRAERGWCGGEHGQGRDRRE